VERGQASLGLVGKKSASPSLEFRAFAHDRMALFVAAKHPLARRKQIRIEQLCREPLIVREAGSASRGCLEQALARVGKSAADLNVVLELSSNEAIKESVLRGVGAAVLSSSVIAAEVKSHKLHALQVADLPLERDIYVIWDRRRVLSLPAQLFVEFLKSSRSDVGLKS
jgi:DNA-binding transcriptional LysR family regulator